MGAPNRQLLTMARKGLRLDLRSALREVTESRRTVVREGVKFEREDDGVDFVSLTVDPLPSSNGDRPLFMVLFTEEAAVSSRPTGGDKERVEGAERLEGELDNARERLQATIEEYETTLEELKSANEELISLNEEMQSSNEELEVFKRGIAISERRAADGQSRTQQQDRGFKSRK